MTRPSPNRRTSRPASVAFEALLVIPVLLAVLLALVEFTMLLAAEQKLGEASGVAARTAAVGRSDEDVKEAVKAVLGKRQYDAAKLKIDRRHDAHIGNVVEVRIDLPAKAAAPCLLRHVGIDLCGETLIGRTLMRME